MEITITELQQKIDRMYSLKIDAEEKKKIYSESYAAYDQAKNEVIGLLDEQKIDRFEGSECKVTRVVKSSVRVPKSPEAKKALFDFLKEKHGEEQFNMLVGINANTFNAYYNAEESKAADAGEFDFSMPGVEQPKSYSQLQIRKK